MPESSSSNLTKIDIELEKKVETFAEQTIKDSENRSKIFNNVVKQIANVSNVRK